MTNLHIPLQDERTLWSRLREGDREAFSEIYRRFFPLLFRYCIRFTDDRDLVKDVLQDFFTQLYLKRHSLTIPDKLKSYLLVAARRELVRRLGKENRRAGETLHEEGYDFSLELSAEHLLINRQHEEKTARQLQRSMYLLTDRQKEAIYLRFYESMGYDEIAGIMQLKEVKYARTLVYRAITELKVVLENERHLLSNQ
ncbi:RNA polymerase sigma factor [Chitinophaga lutea]|uniref:RNA polymerase sigma factor n=1 Tax=Chitinophaga lutea TaxID=2488634 RepID=A0A3N4PJ01_9BACT|nr:RNA polymerase sigma factor [Chitinophaga lutea]RPE08653.1 RNA polymerase sigma factor [Chitinophaga lutea]